MLRFFALITLIFLGGATAFAEGCDVPSDKVMVLAAESTGGSVADAANQIFANDPEAKVFVPENNVQDTTITSQPADGLNTMVLLLEYGCITKYYLVSPRFTMVEGLSLVAFNLAYLRYVDLFGRWTLAVQRGSRLYTQAKYKLNFISQADWETRDLKNPALPIQRASAQGNIISHTTLSLAFYTASFLLAHVSDLNVSLSSVLETARTTATMVASGIFWSMVSLRGDKLPDTQRAVTRQSYYAFNNLRATAIGVFVPLIVATDTYTSVSDFLVKNSVFLLSGVAGFLTYYFADPITAQSPRVARVAAAFQRLTERLNPTCEKIIRGARVFGIPLVPSSNP